MKILHTSDWHLGRTLYGRKRYDEFAAFLDWLEQTIQVEKVDALLVAGDVFDTSTPSNRAQELYYHFLCRVATSCCRHIVIIGGNHDSPSFLNAPKTLLHTLNVHVVSAMTTPPEDEVIVLQSGNTPEAIVCAVPYLRDKDIRTIEPGETIDNKNTKLLEGMKKHYAVVCTAAAQKRMQFNDAGHGDIPIIAMGHLFTTGGKIIDGDGVRDLYVGSLAYVEAEIFPAYVDYVALGHLHIPQKVGSTEHIRYSGSPIPMGYGEANQQKQVLLITFSGRTPDIDVRPIPCFQRLIRIVGSLEDIHSKLVALKQDGSHAWLEIEYTGSDHDASGLREQVETAIAGSAMEIRRIKNQRVMARLIQRANSHETLDELDINEVFQRRLDASEVPVEARPALINAYNDIITAINEEDINAE